MDLERAMQLVRNQREKVISNVRALNPELAKDLTNLRLDWYRINNQAKEKDTTEIFIYDIIDPWFGVSATEFAQELNEITTANISVRINSPGGSVFESIAIYNALVKHPANVTVYVDALAASGASVIAMAGDKLVMMVGSQLMIHDAMGVEIGNAKEHREYATFLDDQSANIAGIYAHRAGGDAKDWRAMMLKETWMFADEAVTLGLADEVYQKPTDEPDTEKEKDKPEEDKPAEDAPEEDKPAEDEDDVDDLEDLMNRRHALANRGYKFPGRKKAPAPTNTVADDDTNFGAFICDLIDSMPLERK
jgi:ATP-dependent protease ClpP protease subunit